MQSQDLSDGQQLSTVEQLILRFKINTYSLLNDLLSSQICSPFLFKLLIFIETLQMLYYSIFEKLPFLWPTDIVKIVRTVVQYIQFSKLLDDGNETIFILLLYLVFIIQFIMLILFIVCIFKQNSKQNSVCFIYAVKGLSTYAIFLNTIFTIPFFNIVIATFYCKQESLIHMNMSCYDGIYFLHFTIAIVTCILLLLFQFLFIFLFIDLNPNSSVPFAQIQQKINFFRLGIKIFLPTYYTIDYAMDIPKYFIIIITVFYLIVLLERYRNPPFYNRSVFYFTIVCETILFWITFCVLIHAFLDFGDVIDNTGIVYTIIGCPISALLFYLIIQQRNKKLLYQTSKQLKSDKDIEMYVIELIDLVNNYEQQEKQLLMEAVIRYHQKQCQEPECICQNFMKTEKNEKNDKDSKKVDEQTNTQKQLFQFVQQILQYEIEKSSKNPQLYILNAYILNQNLDNRFKSLYELQNADENKPNTQQEFSIFRYRYFIEEQMIDYDSKQIELKGVDVNITIKFQNKFVVFLSQTEHCVNLYLEFWRELLDENPDIQKLELLGSKITLTLEKNAELFKGLVELNPNHLKCLTTYGHFLKDIVSDDIESQQILEKVDYVKKSAAINKQFVDQDRLKYGENSNTCIINCSGNKNYTGIVTNCNNEIQRILGFTKEELIEHNINRIMPKIYADFHDQWMDRYLQTSEEKILGTERQVLSQNKAGYLVPSSLMIKILPHLREGIIMVGFISNYVEPNQSGSVVHYLAYNKVNQNILGISESCYDTFGIPSSLVYGNSKDTNEFTIDQVAPEIDMPGQNQDELLQPQGCLVTFNTQYIQQNFLLQDDDNTNESDYNDENNHSITGNNLSVTNNITAMGNNTKNQTLNVTNMGNAVNESMLSKDKNSEQGDMEGQEQHNKFKKTKVRVHLESEDEYSPDVIIRIIKFIEVDENQSGNFFGTSKLKTTMATKTTGNNSKMGQTTNLQQNKQEDIQEMDYEDEANKSDEDNENDEKNQQEEEDENLNEDMRSLNDIKAMISKKSIPKSIQILKKLMILMLLVIVVLSVIEMQYNSAQRNAIRETVTAIDSTYMRHNTMADINYISRKIQLTASEILPFSTSEVAATNENDRKLLVSQLQSNLTDHVNLLQNIQFETIQADIKRKDREDNNNDEQTYEIVFQLQTGNTETYQQVFTDAVFSYITAASSLTNSTYDSFITDFNYDSFNGQVPVGTGRRNLETTTAAEYQESSQKNLFLVRQNGLFVLREGSIEIAEDFYKFYEELTSDYQTKFAFIMSAALVFVIAASAFLIPIVFNVHKTNNKVLSLFGIIPSHEIKSLAYNCEVYIQEHIEDQNKAKDTKRILDQTQINNQNFLNVSQQQPLNESNMPMNQELVKQQEIDGGNTATGHRDIPTTSKTPHGDNQYDQSNVVSAKPTQRELLGQNQTQQPQSNGNQSEITDITKNGKNKNPNQKLENNLNQALDQVEEQLQFQLQQIEDKKNQEENDGERSDKLLNYQDGNKKFQVILQFSIFALLIMAYFIISFILQVGFQDSTQIVYTQMKYVCIRPSILKYNVIFTMENIITGGTQPWGSSTSLRNQYYNEILENDRSLYQSYGEDYPSQFDKYKDKFNQLNYQSICEFSQNVTNTADCEAISNGILVKGLRTSVVSLIEETSKIISDYNKQRSALTATSTAQQLEDIVLNTINGDSYREVENMLYTIIPAMIELKDLLKDSIEDFMDANTSVGTIKFIVFLIIIVLIFIFVWTPYLKSLNNKIWRTKGMLNMIPIDIIIRNEKLRSAMKSGEILDAVK